MFTDYYLSRIGIIQIKASDKGIISMDFVSDRLETNPNLLTSECKKQLNEYFDKQRKVFDLPYELNGTDFQKKVWMELLKIPFGKTLSYKEVAINIGAEKGVRAVANAVGANRHIIFIPCHRVIGSDRSLTGFGAGLDRKEFLLKLEDINNYKK